MQALQTVTRAIMAVVFLGATSLAAWAGDDPNAPNMRITAAPPFGAEHLTALPRQNWITNGGNIYNWRYSPLDQINRKNVDELKGEWRTSMGSGAGPRNSGETQILAYKGTLYVSNGANDVFAMDVETGEIIWDYSAHPNPKAGAPVGWANRGVALGDGKVFLGTVDARLVALDQETGQVLWDIQAERWQDGFSITSAPLYYDDMVITGFSGGEYGIRGRVKAYDADTGELEWTFYTIPGPGQYGHDTWPGDSDAWKRGGAPVWQTPAVDPELGMIYFSTGNPAPDLHGGKRPGDNLFSVSIVALDVQTGEYEWHFQEVHHDLWDYDASNPVILFDAEIDGEMRKGLVQVSKTGWAYILDRKTGEPLIGIEEKPVAQEPRQATSPTQPFPKGDSIVPQSIDIPPQEITIDPKTKEAVNGGRIFTPFWKEPIAVKPGTMGGANWPPSSYDPETNHLYVCATDRISQFSVDAELDEPAPGEVYMGGRFTQAPAEDRGIFAALDVTTNELVWRRQWQDICYSGSVVTAGGLLFVGRNDGRLTALDKTNGEKLWEFMTDAGVNTTVTTFLHDGTQYVAVHAGGAAFAGSERGDTVWLFSREGTIGPVTEEEKAQAKAAAAEGGEAEKAAEMDFNLDRGEKLYMQACLVCHGKDGQGGQGGGAPLTQDLSVSRMVSVMRSGRDNMPPFGSQFSDAELQDIAGYVLKRMLAEN